MPSQPPPGAGYPPQYGPGPPGAPSPYSLPQPISSGSVDLSSIKPVSSGSVSIADAIAKARGFAAEKGVAYDASRGMKPSRCLNYFLISVTKVLQEMQTHGCQVEVIVAHAHHLELPLEPSGTTFATTTILTVMNAGEPTIEVIPENDHFHLGPRDISLRLYHRDTLRQETDLLVDMAEVEMATLRLFPSRKAWLV